MGYLLVGLNVMENQSQKEYGTDLQHLTSTVMGTSSAVATIPMFWRSKQARFRNILMDIQSIPIPIHWISQIIHTVFQLTKHITIHWISQIIITVFHMTIHIHWISQIIHIPILTKFTREILSVQVAGPTIKVFQSLMVETTTLLAKILSTLVKLAKKINWKPVMLLMMILLILTMLAK